MKDEEEKVAFKGGEEILDDEKFSFIHNTEAEGTESQMLEMEEILKSSSSETELLRGCSPICTFGGFSLIGKCRYETQSGNREPIYYRHRDLLRDLEQSIPKIQNSDYWEWMGNVKNSRGYGFIFPQLSFLNFLSFRYRNMIKEEDLALSFPVTALVDVRFCKIMIRNLEKEIPLWV